MKKKNGFTLIELLAVIVILAVIALIAVPQVLKILNKARKSAAEDTTYGIIKAAENYVTNFMLENNGTMPSESLEFECDGNSCNLKTTLTGYNLTGLDKLDFKGTKPNDGTIIISNNGGSIVANNLRINGFSCNYANANATCTSDSSSETNPTPSLTGPTSEIPAGNGYTGVKAIVYLDPTDLIKSCDASNSNSDVGMKTGCMKWYAYADDGTNYTMILDHNTTATVAWNTTGNNSSMVAVANQLAKDTIESGWVPGLNPRLITGQEIANITRSTSWTAASSSWYYFDTLTQSSTKEGKYGWLFDRTSSDCTAYGCLNNATGDNISNMYGYWTSTSVSDNFTHAWRVHSNAYLGLRDVTGVDTSVRPVITVNKSYIS